MGAVPKSRIGPRRRRLRRTHFKLGPVALVQCSTCAALIPPHRVCPDCGSLHGVRVVEVGEAAE